jgi:drug/metabolite transporter (DMT)-like permease
MIFTRAYRPFAVLLLLDVCVFLLQKFASTRADGEGIAFLLSLITHPWVWLPLALGPLQLWLWTRILARTDLSKAYSLTSLSYPLTMVAAVILFHERLPLSVWLGGGLIAMGVALVAEQEEPAGPSSGSGDAGIPPSTGEKPRGSQAVD